VNIPLNDRELEEYLKRDSAVSREYQRLHDDHPPTELQLSVLQRAQAAVEREQLESKPPPARRWMPPFALAASIVLACVVSFEFGLHQQHLLPGTSLKGKEAEPEQSDVTFLLNTPAEAPVPAATLADKSTSVGNAAPQGQIQTRASERREFAAKRELQKVVPSAAPAAPPTLALDAGLAEEKPRADSRQSVPTASASAQPARTPEEWLAVINALKKEGKTKQAEEEIAALRKAYPHAVLQ
jgi:hypothetical protein